MKDLLKLIFSIPGFKKWFAIFAFAVIVAQGFAAQVVPFIDREIVTIIQMAEQGKRVNASSLLPLLAMAMAAAALGVGMIRLSYFIADKLRELVWHQVFRTGYHKLIFHDIEYLSNERSGELLNKIFRASGRISQLLTEASSAFFRNAIKGFVSLIIVFTISWQVGLLLLLPMIFYIIIYRIRFQVDKPLAEASDKLFDKELSRVWEVVPQIKLARIFTNQQKEVEIVDKVAKKNQIVAAKRQVVWTYASVAELIFVQIPTLGIKIWAAYLALNGAFGLPTFVLLYALISSVQEPFMVINWFMWEVQDTTDRAKKYIEILETKEKILDPEVAQKITNPFGDIVFADTTFRYEKGKNNVLTKLNLKFTGNRVNALVGKSGAGKSTITNLICRFYDPTLGSIFIDGVDIRHVKKHDLMKNIGFVMQESFIFSGTIAQNLRYAKWAATETEIVRALKKAHAWEFVKDLPEKIHTEIGERGVKLSGGQKQRLSIARAILKDPPILILDEATNALDSESEVLVQEALEEFMKNRTVIVVAHRLSTVQKADRIFVIGNGGIVEEGTHATLIEKKGVYHMLYTIQSGGFEQESKIMREYEMG